MIVYGFTWLIEGQIGACAYPLEAPDWEALDANGISLLVNLHTRAHQPEPLGARRLEQVHLPVVDLMPPAPEQIDAGVAAIEAALGQGRRVVVHCGAGLGRAGTLLACYLVSTGATPEDAIARVRAARPGSIETRDQAAAVADYARRLQQRHVS